MARGTRCRVLDLGGTYVFWQTWHSHIDWFPIEPHARTPFLHWVPESISYRIVMMRRCGSWARRTNVSDAVEAVQSNRMLDKRQFAELFPDAEIISERFLGFTKSMIALRRDV